MKPNSKLPYIICLIIFSVVLASALLINHLGSHSIYLSNPDSSIANENSDSPIISGKVNINSASVEELAMLPGIGDALAQRIIDYREKHGAFQSKKDLLNVKGIGDAKLNSIFDYITIGGMS